MSVDQIKEKISHLFILGSLFMLTACPQQQIKESPGPAPEASAAPLHNQINLEPPLPLKRAEDQVTPVLQVLASLKSRDRAGHRRLQLYLQHDLPVDQAFYWQVITLYRSQYDVIWIYLHASKQLAGEWHDQAAWFAPEIPKEFHIPGFKAKAEHDGLYWTDS